MVHIKEWVVNLGALASRHSRQTPRRVRHKLQVNERRLYRAVPQPARQGVVTYQIVRGVTIC